MMSSLNVPSPHDTGQRKSRALMSVLQAEEGDEAVDCLVDKIVEIAEEVLDSQRVLLFFVGTARQDLFTLTPPSSPPLILPLDRGIPGFVARTGRLHNSTNAFTDPNHDSAIDLLIGLTTRTSLCLPIVNSAGIVYAVLQAINKRRPGEDDDDGPDERKEGEVDAVYTEDDEEIGTAFCVGVGSTLRRRLTEVVMWRSRRGGEGGDKEIQSMLEIYGNGTRPSPHDRPMDRGKRRSLGTSSFTSAMIASIYHPSIPEPSILQPSLSDGSPIVNEGRRATWTRTMSTPFKGRRVPLNVDLSHTTDLSVLSSGAGQGTGAQEGTVRQGAGRDAYTLLNGGAWLSPRGSRRGMVSSLSASSLYTALPPSSRSIAQPPISSISYSLPTIQRSLSSFSPACVESVSLPSSSPLSSSPAFPSSPSFVPLAEEGKESAPVSSTSSSLVSASFSASSDPPSSSLNSFSPPSHSSRASSVPAQSAAPWAAFDSARDSPSVPSSSTSSLPSSPGFSSQTSVQADLLRSSFSLSAPAPVVDGISSSASSFSSNSSAFSTSSSSSSSTSSTQASMSSDSLELPPSCLVSSSSSFHSRTSSFSSLSSPWPSFPSSQLPSLSILCSLSFNPFDYCDDALLHCCLLMLSDLHLISHFSLSLPTLQSFLLSVRAKYRSNPYHNFYHAASVMQFAYFTVRTTEAGDCLPKLDLLALLIAALCHDIDHPGTTNTFQVMAASELALLHNDQAVLENHHAATTFSLLSNPSTSIFSPVNSKLSQQEVRSLRKMMIASILATDMARHFDMCHELDAQEPECQSINWHSEADRQFIINLITHSSDLSGQITPLHIAKEWEDRVTKEFMSQSNLEVKYGFPLTLHIKDLHVERIRLKNHINFLDFVMTPLWTGLVELFPAMRPCAENLVRNRKYFMDRMKEEGEERGTGEAEVVTIHDDRSRCTSIDEETAEEMGLRRSSASVNGHHHTSSSSTPPSSAPSSLSTSASGSLLSSPVTSSRTSLAQSAAISTASSPLLAPSSLLISLNPADELPLHFSSTTPSLPHSPPPQFSSTAPEVRKHESIKDRRESRWGEQLSLGPHTPPSPALLSHSPASSTASLSPLSPSLTGPLLSPISMEGSRVSVGKKMSIGERRVSVIQTLQAASAHGSGG